MNTWVGKMGLKGISMALSDFYSSHVHYKTRLELHVRDSKDNVVGAAAAAVELLKTEQVKAIIGPLTSMQANFLIHLGEEAHVPIISFSATSPSLSYLRSPYFFRAVLNDSSQVQPITAIIQAFGWKEVVPIYIENEYGEGLIPFLTDTFQENEIRVLYKSIIHPMASDEEIVAELYKLMTMQTRVFIVHMTRSLSARLFTKANEIGMMSEGYVWIITDGITNSLNFFDPSIIIDSMQGVIGVQPHVPKSKKLEDFISKWKNKKHQEKTSSGLNVFRLWAYDAATALAMAVEKVGPLNLSISNIAKNSTTDFESVGVSQNGIHLCQALSSTRFRGLSGNFSFVDGQLQSSAFEIVNVIGNGPRGIGFWTLKQGIVRQLKFDAVNTSYKDYSTSQANLKAIIWPGDITYTPKGWVVPTNGKVLRVAVPVKNFFSDFVRVRRDPITNRTMVTGYCIDVFEAAMAALPYSVPYEYIPFKKPYGVHGGFDILLHQLFLGKFDAVVGDVTIRENRSNYVDFTFPYTESGVTMIVPFKDKKNYKSAWVFLKPLTWDLWVTSTCFFVFIAFVIWILEHQINEDFNGTPLRQVSNSVWFSFSTIFSNKEKVVSNLARFVVIIWCFVVLILTQSYTASLTSLLTVHQLEPSITDVQELINKRQSVGYPKVSFIYDIMKRMNFSDSQLKGYNTVEGELDAALSNRSIVAAFDEIPYLKLFTGRHCSKYTMVAPIHKTGGFGFVYSLSLSLSISVSLTHTHTFMVLNFGSCLIKIG
ncbi:Glutamate receptor 2.7 [Camellia lanceoleosa]|uniref:Glutamate receptor 2.7 n=1 Tax=Camellia lanceoleosa TaxID=1840588 RepID=A0ACC0J237_9ERIC|nr:Glutamate receptor 2.7 [Camellia lanceoleosa]